MGAWLGRSGLAGALLVAGIATAGVARGGESGERLAWQLSEFPPAIVIGDTVIGETLPGSGFAIDFLRHAIARMPDYRHVFEESSIARAVGLMQQGQEVCHPVVLKTPERLAYMDFSGPVYLALPHHVIVRGDRQDRLRRHTGADGTVDVGALVRDERLVTTVTEKRAFPPIIADALASVGDQKHIVRANVDFQAPFQQLVAGWIDYAFAYPYEVGWYAGRSSLSEATALTYFPIRGMPEAVIGHVGCTRSAWGRRVLERIDVIVRAAGPRPPWYDSQLRFMDANGARRTEEVFSRHNPFAATP